MRPSRSTFSFVRTKEEREVHNLPAAQPRASCEHLRGSTKRHTEGSVIPSSADLEITHGLLRPSTISAAPDVPSWISNRQTSENGGRLLLPRNRLSSQTTQLSTLSGTRDTDSRVTSGSWTTVSERIANSSSVSASRNGSGFTNEYNRLAQEYGLSRLSRAPTRPSLPLAELDCGGGASTQPKPPPRSWLYRKFVRKTASTRNIKSPSKRLLTAKMSTSDIRFLHNGRVDRLNVQSLEDISRLGGVSIFILPTEFTPYALAIPTCLAATGNYIAHHWRTTSGIFRIPGAFNKINALFDHYAHQINHVEKKTDQVQTTVSSGLLPAHLSYDIDDVASTFKKFLFCLPGGILGSLWLFNALRDIEKHPSPPGRYARPNFRSVRAKLIALAIASLETDIRISVICAVFGLLSMIGSEAESGRLSRKDCRQDVGRSSESSEMMGYHALAVVFGPLLLGDLTDSIHINSLEVSGIPEALLSRSSLHHPKARDKAAGKQDHLALQLGRARVTMEITEMLIASWIDVARQLRESGALSRAQLSTMPETNEAGSDRGQTQRTGFSELERALSFDMVRDFADFGKPGTSNAFRKSTLGLEMPRRPMSDGCAKTESDMPNIKEGKSSRSTGTNVPESLAAKKPKDYPARKKGDISGPEERAFPSPSNNGLAGSQQHRYNYGQSGNSINTRERHATAGSLSPPKLPRPLSYLPESLIPVQPRHIPTADKSFEITQEEGNQDRDDVAPEKLHINSEPVVSESEQRQDIKLKIEIPGSRNADAHSDVYESNGSRSRTRYRESSPNFGVSPQGFSTGARRSIDGNSLPALTKNLTKPSITPPSAKGPAKNVEQHPAPASQTRNSERPRSIPSSKNAAHLPIPPHRGIPHRGSSLFNGGEAYQSTSRKSDRLDGRSRASEMAYDDSQLSINVTTDVHEPSFEHPKSPVTQYIEFRCSADHLEPPTANQHGRVSQQSTPHTKGNATLYAEIQRLQSSLDARTEELRQVQRRLETMKTSKESRAMSGQLRETQRELKAWRTRAEWAEARLLMQELEARRSKSDSDGNGDVKNAQVSN